MCTIPNGSACISLNFVLPPEIIKEYFDGLTKVEAAKHGSGFNWSSLLSLAVPTLLPLLVNSCSSTSPKCSTKVPKPKSPCTSTETTESTKVNECVSAFKKLFEFDLQKLRLRRRRIIRNRSPSNRNQNISGNHTSGSNISGNHTSESNTGESNTGRSNTC